MTTFISVPQLTEAQKLAVRLLRAERPSLHTIRLVITALYPDLSAKKREAYVREVAEQIAAAEITIVFGAPDIRDAATGSPIAEPSLPRVSGCCGDLVTVDFATGTCTCRRCEAVLERPVRDVATTATTQPDPDEPQA